MIALEAWRYLVVLILGTLHCYADYSNKAGPYDLVIFQIKPCKDVGTNEVEMYIKIKKLNRETTAIDANLTLKIPFSDDIMSILKLSQFTTGGFKENSYTQILKKSCHTLFSLLPALTKDISKAAKIEMKCPIKPGTYSVYNFTTTEQLKKAPIFFYNKYKAEWIWKTSGRRIGCMEAYVDIVPKKPHLLQGTRGQKRGHNI